MLTDCWIYPESVKIYFRREQKITFSTGEWKISPLCLALKKIKLETRRILYLWKTGSVLVIIMHTDEFHVSTTFIFWREIAPSTYYKLVVHLFDGNSEANCVLQSSVKVQGYLLSKICKLVFWVSLRPENSLKISTFEYESSCTKTIEPACEVKLVPSSKHCQSSAPES